MTLPTFNDELGLSFGEVGVLLLVTMRFGFLVLGHGLPLPQDVEEVVDLGVFVADHGPALPLETGGLEGKRRRRQASCSTF